MVIVVRMLALRIGVIRFRARSFARMFVVIMFAIGIVIGDLNHIMQQAVRTSERRGRDQGGNDRSHKHGALSDSC
jgi:hypothetical protein